MAEILCPTCSRPNPDINPFCDFCGSALAGEDLPGTDPNDLRDQVLPHEDRDPSAREPEPLDEVSRLDSLLSAPEPEPPGVDPGEELSRLDDFAPSLDPPQETVPTRAPREDRSFLDDFDLTPEPPEEAPEAEPARAPEEDRSFLDDFGLAPEPPEEAPEAKPARAPEEDLSFLDDFGLDPEPTGEAPKAESARAPEEDRSFLDDFDLTPEPPEESPEAEPARAPEEDLSFLDDFGLDPEPTVEAPKADPPQTPREDQSFLDDLFASDDPFQETPGETQKSEPSPSPPDSLPGDADIKPASSPDDLQDLAGEWSYLAPDSPRDPGAETPDPLAAPPPEESPAPPEEFAPAGESNEWVFRSLPPDEPADQEKLPEDLPPELSFLMPDPLPGEEPPDPDQEEGTPGTPGADPDPINEFGSAKISGDSGWLRMLQDPEPGSAEPPASGPAPEETPESGPPPEEEKKAQTDWLEKIKRLDQSAEMVDEDSSFPDWLSVTDKAPAEPEPAPEPPPQTPASELPDWLQLDENDESLSAFLRKKDLTDEEFQPRDDPQSQEVPPQIPDGGMPDPDLSDSQPIRFPSWAGEEGPPEEIPEDLQFLAGMDVDDSPQQEGVTPFQMEDEDDINDLFSEELPGWLTSASSGEVMPELDDDLTQAELPGWVEAMRPVVESADSAGQDDDDYIENYGPLAGIPSVLPAEPETALDPETAAKKPLDLIASKSHQEFVTQLKKLISDETRVPTIQKPGRVATQRVLRWLITAILLVTTAAAVVFGGELDTTPPSPAQIRNTGFSALYEEINQLASGEPVLLAFDYQPAAAGELQTASAGVVSHLMDRGTYLSLVSTQPTGPALAESFLSGTLAEYEYLHTQQYINLGYLPGESAGLLSFVIAPKKIIPLAFDGSNAWGSPPLRDVNHINDFSLILVITDDPDTAKIWIEQVGTRLFNTPLTMVVSAQVEPLIQPYFRSSPRLLSGYAAGIIDSMNYEQLLGRPSLASKFWLPFNLGIVVTVVLIFIAGLANGILSLFNRHRARLVGDQN